MWNLFALLFWQRKEGLPRRPFRPPWLVWRKMVPQADLLRCWNSLSHDANDYSAGCTVHCVKDYFGDWISAHQFASSSGQSKGHANHARRQLLKAKGPPFGEPKHSSRLLDQRALSLSVSLSLSLSLSDSLTRSLYLSLLPNRQGWWFVCVCGP